MSSYILGYISKQISWTFEYANWSDNFSRFTHDEGLLYVDQSPGEELTTPQILDFLVKAGRGQIPTRDQPIQDIHELYPQQQVWPPTHFTVRTTNMYVLLRKLLNYYPMANQEDRQLWKRALLYIDLLAIPDTRRPTVTRAGLSMSLRSRKKKVMGQKVGGTTERPGLVWITSIRCER